MKHMKWIRHIYNYRCELYNQSETEKRYVIILNKCFIFTYIFFKDNSPDSVLCLVTVNIFRKQMYTEIKMFYKYRVNN